MKDEMYQLLKRKATGQQVPVNAVTFQVDFQVTGKPTYQDLAFSLKLRQFRTEDGDATRSVRIQFIQNSPWNQSRIQNGK
jgi:hypothetical protein